MGSVVDFVNFVVACVSVLSMGACVGVLDDGSFREVVAKGFVKLTTDEIVLVLVVLDKLVAKQSVDTGEKQN